MSDRSTARARVAALSRSRAADDPVLIAAQQEARELKLADHIRETIDAWPPLTAEQRGRLASLLLRGGDGAS